MSDLPLDHVIRYEPPWRIAGSLTECGRLVVDVASVVERDALRAKIAAQGQQRAAFTTCMVCWDRTKYYSSWAKDPCDVMARDSRGHSDQLHRELQALSVLVEHHREEFEGIMAGLADAGDLEQRRKERRTRRLRS